MPEQFVNPSPNLRVTDWLFFDFPCEGTPPVDSKSTYKAPGSYIGPNVNLTPPAIEQIYGQLGSPKKEQGHPFIREYWGPEPEDPKEKGLVGGVDQVLDIDRGIRTNHTARLSGGFVRFIAGKPFFSSVKVSAVAVASVTAATASINLGTVTVWLTPNTPGPNVWFWHENDSATNELLFTRDVIIRPPLGQYESPPGVGFTAESVYKLVYQWKFWRYAGPVAPATPPSNPESDPKNCERMPMSGFDESIAFEVISKTVSL